MVLSQTPSPPHVGGELVLHNAAQARHDGYGESKPVDIDPDGDLYLKVGDAKLIRPASPPQSLFVFGKEVKIAGKAANAQDDKNKDPSPPTTFRVCSHALARASPVWKKMLYGGFAESKPHEDDWIVALPDDDVPAIEFFLSAIHARFDRVPPFDSNPDPLWLYKVSVVADKYDVVRFLRPWAKSWTQHISKRVEGGAFILDPLNLSRMHYIWILWVLGAEPELKRAIQCESMAAWGRDVTPDVLEPPGVSTMIKEIRLGLITQLLAPFQTAFQQLLGKQATHRLRCKGGDSKCEELMLGKLVRSLNEQFLWPLPNATAFILGVNDLVYRLNTVNSDTKRTLRCRYVAKPHADAVPTLCESVLVQPMNEQTITNGIQVALTEHQKSRIEENGKATGLSARPTVAP